MRLDELKKQHAKLGEEIERLEREGSEIKYVFSVFVSNSRTDKACVYVGGPSFGVEREIVKLPRVVINDRLGYGFSRAYLVGDEVFVIPNNEKGRENEFEILNVIEECQSTPSPEVQEKHRAIIKEYLANRPSRKFTVEYLDTVPRSVNKMIFGYCKAVNDKSDYFRMGNSYIFCFSSLQGISLRGIDEDGDFMWCNDELILELSQDLYDKLLPYLDLSQAVQ